MVVGNYEDGKEYCIVGTLIVKNGQNTAISGNNVPGYLIKNLEKAMKDIFDYLSEK